MEVFSPYCSDGEDKRVGMTTQEGNHRLRL